MPSIVELPQKMVRVTLQMRMTCARDISDRLSEIKCSNLASINKRSNSAAGIESAPILRKRQAPAADRVSIDIEIIKDALMRKMISEPQRYVQSVFTLNRVQTDKTVRSCNVHLLETEYTIQLIFNSLYFDTHCYFKSICLRCKF